MPRLSALVHRHRLGWIEKSDFFCDSGRRACTLFDDDGLPYVWDGAHLTSRSLVRYGRFLLGRIGVGRRVSSWRPGGTILAGERQCGTC